MAYKVIRPFKDLSDPQKHDYALDDVFPRDGHQPSEDFTKGLLTGSNSAGSIFITLVDEENIPDTPPADENVDEQNTLPADDESAEGTQEPPVTDTEDVPEDKPKRKRPSKKAEA
ncbi:hypothetical protein [Streptococcus suis]